MILHTIDTAQRIAQKAARIVAPPPELTLSQWADTYRFLSSEASAEPGKFIGARAPYQRAIMDAMTDPEVTEVVLMMASQTGKTEIFNNAIGYHIHQDPAPIMLVQPTKEIAETWSKDRLTPMVRDTPALRKLMPIDNKRDGENTILHKKFPGGHITISGANSPSSLASRPIRILLLDEIDRYPFSAGREGNPVNLAEKRTTNFWNKKIIKASSPTIRGESQIEAAYENSDKRKLWIKCTHCDEMQKMVFDKLKWDDGKPEEAVYACAHCGCIMTDGDKYAMLESCEWRAEAPFKGIAGFHLSSLYSPWVTFGDFATRLVKAKKDPEELKVFINTDFAETYEENLDGEGIEEDTLTNRVEDYTDAPPGVLLITAAVDVQDDRLEIEILGWGVDEESWSLKYEVIHGDPGTKEVWQDLDDMLEQFINCEGGRVLRIECACIDAGGHHAESVYTYTKSKQRKGRRVYAVRGYSQSWRPVISKPSMNNSHRVKVFYIGTDTAKDTIFSRLKLTEHGAAYCHFPAHYPDEYFKGLTAEKLVKRYHKGRTVKQYIKKTGSARNEPLDLRVYNLAALKILNPNWQALKLRHEKKVQKNPPPDNKPPVHTATEKAPSTKPKVGRGKGGFVNRWR